MGLAGLAKTSPSEDHDDLQGNQIKYAISGHRYQDRSNLYATTPFKFLISVYLLSARSRVLINLCVHLDLSQTLRSMCFTG